MTAGQQAEDRSSMPFIIIGAGGHGNVVLDAARAAGLNPDFFVDKAPSAVTFFGIPVFTSITEGLEASGIEADTSLQFIVAIGDNTQRAAEYQRACAAHLTPLTVIHPTATISPAATVGQGTYIGANVIVNPGARIGDNAIINTAAIVEHDCTVGDHAFVAPGATMCGETSIGAYTLLGANATIIPTLTVGARALIAAGAVVTQSYPDNSRLYGVHARPFSTPPTLVSIWTKSEASPEHEQDPQ
jgi:sugar O-acyltransferase (sialic acid O-acetyltransferase NeuD family)